MKKAVSLVLAAMMAVALPGAALAVEPEDQSHDVTGHYVSGGESSVVYSVDITWDPLNFTYTDAFEGTWNAQEHVYQGATPASWTPGNATITVTNHSNAAITATPSYQAEPEFGSASMIFNKNSLTVASADNGLEGAPGQAVNGTIQMTPSGSLPEGTNDTIGTITITIS